MTIIKICGITTHDTLTAAVANGADMVGFVFYPKSPRHIVPTQAANLSASLPYHIRSVAVLVDPSDDELSSLTSMFKPNFLQLHGIETPERVAYIRNRWSIPVIKAIAVGVPEDLQPVSTYSSIADWLIFDAKTPKGTLPGGMGLQFDWSLLNRITTDRPWLLSGGLTPSNVQKALVSTGAPGVDVSSGVESAPGVKSPELIAAFIKAARQKPVFSRENP